MLQRVQSILLMVAGICMIVFLGTTTWQKDIAETSEQVILNPYYLIHTKGALAVLKKPVYYLALMAVMASGLSIFTIFQYKNRVRQMLLVALNSLLIGATLGVAVYHVQYEANSMGDMSKDGHFSIGFWAVFVALFANWAANRFIRKDDKLVKSADRMR